jgi:hypothetical protein
MMQTLVWPLGVRSHGVFVVKGNLAETFAVTAVCHINIPVSKPKQYYAVVIPGGITARWALSW